MSLRRTCAIAAAFTIGGLVGIAATAPAQYSNPLGEGYYQRTNPLGDGYIQDTNPLGDGYIQDTNPLGDGYVQDKGVFGY